MKQGLKDFLKRVGVAVLNMAMAEGEQILLKKINKKLRIE